MIEIKIQQDAQAGGANVTKSGLAPQISAAQRTNRNEATTLVYEATLLDQKLRSEQVIINSACSLSSGATSNLRSNLGSLTKESCIQDHGLNSVLSGSTCTCKDNYMFNSAQQCMPAGDVCMSEYGQGGIPYTYSECACAYGYHLENGRHCVVDPKPVKMIPTNVKKWSDDNYARNTPCSSNQSFTADELKICEEYSISAYRNKYDWQTPKQTNDERCVALKLGAFYNTDKQSCDTCAAGMEKDPNSSSCRIPPTPPLTNTLVTPPTSVPILSKLKITKEKPKTATVEKRIEVLSTTTSQIIFTATTTDQIAPVITEQVAPVAEEVKTLPPPAPKPKPFWSRIVSWFKFW